MGISVSLPEAVSGETASFYQRGLSCRSISKNSSKNRSKNAASLRAKHRMRKTANFGGRLLSAGNSSFGELDPVGSEQRQREGPMVRETEN